MEDGRDRALRRADGAAGESVSDLLARHGRLDASPSGPQPAGGRAARRRAAEERERVEAGADPEPAVPGGGRHATRPAPPTRDLPDLPEFDPTPANPEPAGPNPTGTSGRRALREPDGPAGRRAVPPSGPDPAARPFPTGDQGPAGPHLSGRTPPPAPAPPLAGPSGRHSRTVDPPAANGAAPAGGPLSDRGRTAAQATTEWRPPRPTSGRHDRAGPVPAPAHQGSDPQIPPPVSGRAAAPAAERADRTTAVPAPPSGRGRHGGPPPGTAPPRPGGNQSSTGPNGNGAPADRTAVPPDTRSGPQRNGAPVPDRTTAVRPPFGPSPRNGSPPAVLGRGGPPPEVGRRPPHGPPPPDGSAPAGHPSSLATASGPQPVAPRPPHADLPRPRPPVQPPGGAAAADPTPAAPGPGGLPPDAPAAVAGFGAATVANGHRPGPAPATGAPTTVTGAAATTARGPRPGPAPAVDPPTTAATTAVRGPRRDPASADATTAVAPADATTAVPSPRPEAAPPADATTAVPGPRSEPQAPRADATTAVPDASATTAVPGTRRPEPAPADATAAVRDDGGQATAVVPAAVDATQVVPGPPDGAETRIVPGTRTARDERVVAASRIDESLIRMTAAHAGLTLASDAEEPEPEPEPGPSRSTGRRAGRVAVRALAGALALAVLAAAGLGWGTKNYLDAAVRDAGALDLTSGAIVDAVAQRGDQNVLIVASDSAREPAARADTVAIVHVPAGGGDVVVLSLPHNLEIDRPSCDRWDDAAADYATETEPAVANTQLVSALDRGGPRCLTRVVQQLTGLAITRYVGLDLAAAESLAAAARGVPVCVPTPVVDAALGTIIEQGGTSTLDGIRAGDFVRAMAVQGDPASEFGRIERQQRFLNAVLERTLAEPSLLDINTVNRLRPALREALLLDGSGLDGALAATRSLGGSDAVDVLYVAAPTTGGADSVSSAVLRDADAATLFAAVREDRPLPEQADDPLAAVAGPAPAQLRVELLNASGREGLADQIGTTLGALGFGIGEIGNADQPTAETIIKFSPDQAAAATLLATSVPSATTVPAPGSTGVLQLVLGRSFDDVVRPPADPAVGGVPPTAVTAADSPPVNCP